MNEPLPGFVRVVSAYDETLAVNIARISRIKYSEFALEVWVADDGLLVLRNDNANRAALRLPALADGAPGASAVERVHAGAGFASLATPSIGAEGSNSPREGR